MASRSLDALSPVVRQAARAFVVECSRRGLRVLIYCTMRTRAEQMALWEQGRTRPGRIVTNARPGQSLHNPQRDGLAWAFDAVPIGDDGAALWADDAALRTMGEAGEAVGLEWAGRWRGKLRERVHFQIQPGSNDG
jgi:peptidoglycan L-alanyl-D-glutamate endopeptidase CwlK